MNDLEQIVGQETVKKVIVDTGSNITYSLIVGGFLDYCSGLNFSGIVASRSSGMVLNIITGGLYGWWREQVFSFTKTTVNSNKRRLVLTDLLAFNTFQTYGYGIAVAVGCLYSEGKMDWEKVTDGITYLTVVSPLIAPTLGWYSDALRKLFKLKPAYSGNEGR